MACFESDLARRPVSRTDAGVSAVSLLPRREAESWTPEEVLRWGFERFGRDIAIASAFGAEGMVLIDIASRLCHGFRVFTLDTGFFFPETYELIEKVEARYGIGVERVRPQLAPAEQTRVHGEALWKRDPDRCCGIRKVDPLRDKLRELAAWTTAIRREQTSARAGVEKIEWDSKFEIVKLNPIADWSHDRVWAYIRRHGVLYNRLHDRNYPSIGCTHCTRPVAVGQDPRAGRWAGLSKTECGLHTRDRAVNGGSAAAR